MEKWTRQDNYIGEEYPEYFVLLGRSRDSDILEESNFAQALEMLGGENDPKVIVVRASHWAVGWVEFIGIREDCAELVAIGEDIENSLKSDYPILNEEDYWQRQDKYAQEYWDSTSRKEKTELLRKYHIDARLQSYSSAMRADDNGGLWDYLTQEA